MWIISSESFPTCLWCKVVSQRSPTLMADVEDDVMLTWSLLLWMEFINLIICKMSESLLMRFAQCCRIVNDPFLHAVCLSVQCILTPDRGSFWSHSLKLLDYQWMKVYLILLFPLWTVLKVMNIFHEYLLTSLEIKAIYVRIQIICTQNAIKLSIGITGTFPKSEIQFQFILYHRWGLISDNLNEQSSPRLNLRLEWMWASLGKWTLTLQRLYSYLVDWLSLQVGHHQSDSQ